MWVYAWVIYIFCVASNKRWEEIVPHILYLSGEQTLFDDTIYKQN